MENHEEAREYEWESVRDEFESVTSRRLHVFTGLGFETLGVALTGGHVLATGAPAIYVARQAPTPGRT